MPPSRGKQTATVEISRSGGKRAEALHTKSRWRRWLLEPALWIAGLVCLLLAGEAAIRLLVHLPFGAEMAAAVAYSGWMVVLIFFPGRAQRGYNPFGRVARRVAGPLLWTHLLALLALMPAVATALYVRARYAPRWFYGVCVAGGVALSFWQALRSSALLEASEQAVGKQR